MDNPVTTQPLAPTTLMTVEQPHLVSLVLQSKKALQHGEQLCSRARSLSQESVQAVVDVLALDAKVRWLSDAVVEQLKLAASVAKCIEEKRAHLNKEVQVWDAARTSHTDALDSILDSLGAQLVPPSFHQSSVDSSLFGSQNSPSSSLAPATIAKEAQGVNGGRSHHSGWMSSSPTSPRRTNGRHDGGSIIPPDHSPSATLRGVGIYGAQNTGRGNETRPNAPGPLDRQRWKTLRDFVDDRAIEEVYEVIENERVALDETLNETLLFPETLRTTIDSIHGSLHLTPQYPQISPRGSAVITTARHPTQVRVSENLTAQDTVSTAMAGHLESLASHYDQMASALREGEAGEVFSDEDIAAMNRDTNELPSIMAELEESVTIIQRHRDQILDTQRTSQQRLDELHFVLDDLDELGEIMTEMLHAQETVEAKMDSELASLQDHLQTLSELHGRYVAYQTAFAKLVLELDRRVQYRNSAEAMVRDMTERLQAMSEEESQLRDRFNAEHGAFLPEDLCICVGNAPTKWEVVPWDGEVKETLPDFDGALIAEARDRVGYTTVGPGGESL